MGADDFLSLPLSFDDTNVRSRRDWRVLFFFLLSDTGLFRADALPLRVQTAKDSWPGGAAGL